VEGDDIGLGERLVGVGEGPAEHVGGDRADRAEADPAHPIGLGRGARCSRHQRTLEPLADEEAERRKHHRGGRDRGTREAADDPGQQVGSEDEAGGDGEPRDQPRHALEVGAAAAPDDHRRGDRGRAEEDGEGEGGDDEVGMTHDPPDSMSPS
jgi:hypothetical protein